VVLLGRGNSGFRGDSLGGGLSYSKGSMEPRLITDSKPPERRVWMDPLRGVTTNRKREGRHICSNMRCEASCRDIFFFFININNKRRKLIFLIIFFFLFLRKNV